MGTDIHVFMEKEIAEKPVLGNSNVILKDYYMLLNNFKYSIREFKSDEIFNIEEDIYDDRNYLLFDYLSGVRSYGRQIELVHNGIPNNVSEQLKKFITLIYNNEYHTPGYFFLSELTSAINNIDNWMWYILHNDSINKELYEKMEDGILSYKFDNITSVDDFKSLLTYENSDIDEYSESSDIPSDSKVAFCRSYTLISFFERILEWLKINEYWIYRDLEGVIHSDHSPLIKKILTNPDLYSKELSKYRMIIMYDS